jgi:hypothetical protein
MSDRVFERSLTAVTGLVLAWIVLGLVFRLLAPFFVILTGVIFEVVVGGILLHFWGKSYMSRL